MWRRLSPFLALLMALAMVGCGAPKPSLQVTVEQSGQDLVVQVITTGFIVGKDGHIHLRLDDGPEAMPSKPTYTLRNVSPGQHRISLELSDPSHRPIGVSETVTVDMR